MADSLFDAALPNQDTREATLAEELAFALNYRRGLSERALEALEDHVLACRAAGVEPHPEVVDCLDGFRGKGQWPA